MRRGAWAAGAGPRVCGAAARVRGGVALTARIITQIAPNISATQTVVW